MKRSFLLSLFIVSVACSYAQIKWNPKWPAGHNETLDYTYTKIEMESDTLKKFDSSHAMIQAKCMGEFSGSYFMQWKFSSFYSDTLSPRSNTDNKWAIQLIGTVVKRCPILFTMEKPKFEVKITNEKQIDSVADVVTAEIVDQMADSRAAEDKAMMKSMIKMLYSLQMDKTIYEPIRNYYSVYKVSDMVPNVKQDIKSELQKKKSGKSDNGLGGLMDSADGFSILEDKDPTKYTWKTEVVFDMSKLMNAFADLAKAMMKNDTTSADDSKQAEAAKAAIPAKSGTTESTEVIISKPDMLVQSYNKKEVSDHLLGIDMSESEQTSIRKVQ